MPLMIPALPPFTGIANAQQLPDPRVADLARAGKIRFALFLPGYAKDPVTGELRGVGTGAVTVQLAQAFAAKFGAEVVLVGYRTPPMVVECLKDNACDLAYMGISPARAAEVGLSPPFMQQDFTYLVPAGSPVRNVADVDRPGVRIAIVRNHASALVLSSQLKHAETIGSEVSDAAFELLRSGRADALAAPRYSLVEYSSRLPGSRVLQDRYGANFIALAVPKSNAGRLAYLSEFVEEAKASGLVQRAIDRAGLHGYEVVAPENPNARK